MSRFFFRDADLALLYQEFLRQMRMLAGVESVAVIAIRPGSWWSNNTCAGADGKDSGSLSWVPRVKRHSQALSK
jgi:hypothetical protein